MADGFHRSFMMASNEDQQRLQLQVISIRDRFANRNSNTAMAAGPSHRTLGVQAESRMIRKTCHAADHTRIMMMKPQHNHAGMVTNAEQVYYVMDTRYYKLTVHHADLCGVGATDLIGGGFGQGAITQQHEPEKLDLSLKLGPPGSYPPASSCQYRGN